VKYARDFADVVGELPGELRQVRWLRRWLFTSRWARAFDIAQLQIGQPAGSWRSAGQYLRPK
jgi:hypothetical protein